MKKPTLHSDLIVQRLYEVLTHIPEPKLNGKPSDEAFVKGLIRQSAIKSSSVSAALSVPGGVAGILSVVPDVMTVWRIQAQMISNIAAAYGKNSLLTREQMLWCMFRQVGVGLVKELVVQQGGRYLVQHYGKKSMAELVRKLGISIAHNQASRWAGRIIPVVGSVSAGALTYYDTNRVGKNAMQLYSKDVILLPPPSHQQLPY
ncbi:MAG: hypothetical protein ACPF9D_14540 [Owenweeksia sp.]